MFCLGFKLAGGIRIQQLLEWSKNGYIYADQVFTDNNYTGSSVVHRRRAAEGDGFVTKETADGPIIVNQREQQRALEENEEYFVDHEGVRRIRVRKSGHRGR